MTDNTTTLLALERLYEDYQDTRTTLAREIRKEYRRKADEEVERVTLERKMRLAEAIRDAVENGVTGSEIRSQVLHTQDWTRWRQWRDLAQITPEREAVRAAKAEEAFVRGPIEWDAHEEWSSQNVIWFELVRDADGKKIEPLVFPYDLDAGAARMPHYVYAGGEPVMDRVRAMFRDVGDFAKFATRKLKEEKHV